ncbi:PREDICTED: uncharacterized protein LOC104710940 isoform X2 [Camelina sativa]|uniref:Uncharacterized protein LOC104710940 isoform X2 n=1 Tax=Camelina sativa TaxID=90675 RepID=A0ABM1QGV7_CAMSA|nr:PREDICTED: uncharacterized protein LOC104710940 isoform X2 [Camelina sativa]
MKLRISQLPKVPQNCLIFSSRILEDVHFNVNSQPSGPVIFLGSLMKTLLYKGKGTVQSSKFTTKIYISSPLPEIIQFQEALCTEEPRTSIIEIKSSSSIKISKQSFLLSERKTIIKLMESYQAKSCNILASISLAPKTSWFYNGCTICFTKVTQYFNPKTEELEEDNYSCVKCAKQITTTQPWFKLHIKATDITGSTSLILFDDVVIPLIKKFAYELLEQQVQFNREGETPQELLDLDGRCYVFKIMLKDDEKHNQSSSYKVISLIDVLDIIQSFSESDSTLNANDQERITVSGTSTGTSIGTSIQCENISSAIINIDNGADNVFNTATPTPTRKRSFPASKDVQQSTTKPKLMSKSQIKKEKK